MKMSRCLYIILILVTFFSCKKDDSDLVPSLRIELENNKYLYVHKYNDIIVLSATCEDVNSKFFFEKYQKLFSEIVFSKNWKYNMISVELKSPCMDSLFVKELKRINNNLFEKVSYSINDNVFFIIVNYGNSLHHPKSLM